LKCPKCHVELIPTERHQLTVNSCPSCKGMWLDGQELGQLENEVFDFGEHAKGTLVVDATPTTDQCPACSGLLQRFRYRFYDLEMELCRSGHGYWLEHDEDNRVLELMKREEQDLKRKLRAEDQWASLLKHMRSRSFFDKVRGLFR
jgi:Zn-finger nucleic acid-binding protein